MNSLVYAAFSPSAMKLAILVLVLMVALFMIGTQSLGLKLVGGVIMIGAVVTLIGSLQWQPSQQWVWLIVVGLFAVVAVSVFNARSSRTDKHAIAGVIMIAVTVAALYVTLKDFVVIPTGIFGDIISTGWDAAVSVINTGVGYIVR